MRVLLNIDLGELPDEPEALYVAADVASLACGGHAGDDASMRRALLRCAAHNVLVLAHPSFPDRARFGRVAMDLPAAALAAEVQAQCARLVAQARELGVPVKGVKPHGALYHAADRDPALAAAVVDGALAALGPTPLVVGPAGGALAQAALTAGARYWREGFADRQRERGADGRLRLVPRDRPGAVLTDPTATAALAAALVAEGEVETICVHGDGAAALAVAAAVRAALGPKVA